MATLDSLVAQLRQAADRIHQAVEQVRGARHTAKECQAQSQAVGVTGVARRFQGIADRTDELERVLLAGIDAMQRLIAQTEAIRHGGSVSGTGGTVPGTPAGGASAPEPVAKVPVTPGWRQRFAGEVPEHVRDTGSGMRPRRPDDARYTLGVLDRERIQSGGEDAHLANDLVWPRKAPPITYWQHVESKVAARMRDEARRRPDTPPRAEVVIDNTVCGTNERDRAHPWVCDKVLSGILPRDSTLVVWTTCDGGRTFYRRAYRGTGERIRR